MLLSHMEAERRAHFIGGLSFLAVPACPEMFYIIEVFPIEGVHGEGSLGMLWFNTINVSVGRKVGTLDGGDFTF